MTVEAEERPFLSDRRLVLAGGLALAAAATIPLALDGSPRALRLSFPATGERIEAVFHDGRGYLTDGVETISRFLVDFETGEWGPMAVTLFDRLFVAQQTLAPNTEIEVVRGFLSQNTDKPFAAGTPNGYHTEGRALDFRIPAVDFDHVLVHFVNWFDGGVGGYPKGGFLHVDTGSRRTWMGS